MKKPKPAYIPLHEALLAILQGPPAHLRPVEIPVNVRNMDGDVKPPKERPK